jgi:acetyl esterase/lipase
MANGWRDGTWRAVGALLATLAALLLLGRESKADVMSGLFNQIVAERGVAIDRDIAFGPLPRHRLDVYSPVAPTAERRPVVLFFYGGGWTSGERATYRFVGAALAAQGYRTVIADYRLYPEVGFPDFLEDADAAYRWTSAQVRDACGGPRPIIVAGHSAGAYIAAMLPFDRAQPKPAAFIGLAGPYSFDPTTWPTTRAIFTKAAGRPDSARPVALVKGGAPPALLLHGVSDTTVKLYNTTDLAKALRQHGAEVERIDYDGIGHVGLVTAIARPLRWRAPVLADMVRFMERHGGGRELAKACKTDAPLKQKNAPVLPPRRS